MDQYRPTWVSISTTSFAHNVREMKRRAGRRVAVMAVLKADAYGHGAGRLAPVALKAGAEAIGVSSLEEGITLRQSGVLAPILILGGLYPFKNFSEAVKARLTPTIASFEAARHLFKISKMLDRPIAFHLKVDTGMGRIGVSPEGAVSLLDWISRRPSLRLAGLYSHLATADDNGSFARLQIRRFKKVARAANDLEIKPILLHLANSAGALRFKGSHFNLIRPGLALYGLSPFANRNFPSFSPVLNWQTRVIFLKKVPVRTPISYGQTFVTKRPSVIATLPVGYADGVPRLASNRGHVLVRDRACPVVGRVTMDHTMIDVTGKNVRIGDKATLIGKQHRSFISAWDWARWAETNAYEICCQISKRVPRTFE